MARRIEKITLMTVGIMLVIAIDQLAKYIIRFQGGFYVCNNYLAWGIKIPENFFWALWIIIMAILAYFIYKEIAKASVDFWVLTGITLVCAGALSNMMDRIYAGCVIDFISFWPFPAFNIADFCITLGGISIGFNFWRHKSRNTV